MKKIFSAAMLPLLLLGACTSSEPDMMSLQENIKINNPNFINVEEALKNADSTIIMTTGLAAHRKSLSAVIRWRHPNFLIWE